MLVDDAGDDHYCYNDGNTNTVLMPSTPSMSPKTMVWLRL